MKHFISVFLLFIWMFSVVSGQENPYKEFGIDNSTEDLPQGLAVGTDAPNFKLYDVNGDSHELYSSLDKPIILIFYRGNWCGHCNRYLSRIQDSLKYINKAGAMLWAITPQTLENAEIMQNKQETNFPILSDVTEEVMISYDVIFNVTKSYQHKISIGKFTSISGHNGQEEAHLPVPATFIIDKNHKIIFRHFDYNYSKRASVEEILAALSKIQ